MPDNFNQELIIYAAHAQPIAIKLMDSGFTREQKAQGLEPSKITVLLHFNEKEKISPYIIKGLRIEGEKQAGLPCASFTLSQLVEYIQQLKEQHEVDPKKIKLCSDGNLGEVGKDYVTAELEALVRALEVKALFLFTTTPECIPDMERYVTGQVTTRAYQIPPSVLLARVHLRDTTLDMQEQKIRIDRAVRAFMMHAPRTIDVAAFELDAKPPEPVARPVKPYRTKNRSSFFSCCSCLGRKGTPILVEDESSEGVSVEHAEKLKQHVDEHEEELKLTRRLSTAESPKHIDSLRDTLSSVTVTDISSGMSTHKGF